VVRDADEIARYIACRDPVRATAFRTEVIEHARSIGEFPQAHPVRDDIAPGVRAAHHGRYLIVYREFESYIRVVRILHSARELARAMIDRS